MRSVTGILFSLRTGSGGSLEANCAQKLVEVVTDALIEAIELGLFLSVQF